MKITKRCGGCVDDYVKRAGVAQKAARRSKVALKRHTRRYLKRLLSEAIQDSLNQ